MVTSESTVGIQNALIWQSSMPMLRMLSTENSFHAENSISSLMIMSKANGVVVRTTWPNIFLKNQAERSQSSFSSSILIKQS